MSVKLKCLVVDDEPMALEKVVNYIGKIPYLDLTATCSSAVEAMQVLADANVDVMFIDINMPDISGLDFVKSLVDPPIVVFVTAYAEYAVDSYKVRAVDYLLKPYDFSDFQTVAGNVLKHWNYIHPANPSSAGSPAPSETDILYLKVDYRYVRVPLRDIIYIEGMNEYLKVHVTDGDPLLTHTTFRHIHDYLPDHFRQIHRSYLVNMDHVREVERSVILLSDGTRLSISDSNKDGLMQYLQRYALRK